MFKDEPTPPWEKLADHIASKGWSKTKLAEILGVNPSTVTRLLKGEIPINAEFAIKLWLKDKNSNKTAYTWMNYQVKWDLYQNYILHNTQENYSRKTIENSRKSLKNKRDKSVIW